MRLLPHFVRLVVVPALVTASVASAAGGNGQAPGQQPPSDVSPPSVSGTAQVGQTLTADTGSWSGPAVTLSLQWQRCDSYGNGCVDIAAATSTSYAPGVGDVGSTVRVVVTASNKN